MNFNEWLKKKKIGKAAFSRKVGVSIATMQEACHTSMSEKTAARIRPYIPEYVELVIKVKERSRCEHCGRATANYKYLREKGSWSEKASSS